MRHIFFGRQREASSSARPSQRATAGIHSRRVTHALLATMIALSGHSWPIALAIALFRVSSCIARPRLPNTFQEPLVYTNVSPAIAHTNLSAFHAAYHPLHEIEAYMHGLASQHPDLVSIVELGHSAEGREMYALRIGQEDDAEELREKAAFVISGPQHAREASNIVCQDEHLLIMACLVDWDCYHVIPCAVIGRKRHRDLVICTTSGCICAFEKACLVLL